MLSKRVNQSQLTMEPFSKELSFNRFAQSFPDNTLSSLTNFSPWQLDLEGQWEIPISEKILPINVPNCHRGNDRVF